MSEPVSFVSINSAIVLLGLWSRSRRGERLAFFSAEPEADDAEGGGVDVDDDASEPESEPPVAAGAFGAYFLSFILPDKWRETISKQTVAISSS